VIDTQKATIALLQTQLDATMAADQEREREETLSEERESRRGQ
jgi:hypothetical protein